MERFKDRRDAGRKLAEKLAQYKGQPDTIILGLPRGGVPVADEIADKLDLPMDVYVVRKLGTPMHEELAMGAIASNGAKVLNESVIKSAGVQDSKVEEVVAREQKEVRRREELFRGDREPLSSKGKTVIIVDDGLATGATMKAAVQAVRSTGSKKVVVAVGAAPRDTYEEFQQMEDADEIVSVITPRVFIGVGRFYENFTQTTDEEVQECLKKQRS